MMPRPRVRLIDVMALVAFAAIAFAFKAYLDRTPILASQVHEPAFAIYVAVLCAAAIAALAGRPRWRPFWGGVALFGGIYLVTGLNLGWGVEGFKMSESLLFRCKLALPLGLLCGMATQWLVVPTPPGEHVD